jgi:hypothetical protein
MSIPNRLASSSGVISKMRSPLKECFSSNSKKRSIPIELANSQTKYDVKRYCEILEEVTNTVTEPFGLTLKNEFAM